MSDAARSGSMDDAARLIRAGSVVAFPTETVYGLGADATNDTAVQEIFRLKGRPSTNPLIVHVADFESIQTVAQFPLIEPQSRALAALRELWPGPLTVVLPKRPEISTFVSAGGLTVGVRIPAHPLALELIRRSGRPIAAPSANRSNYVSPTSAAHVATEFGDEIPLILDGGPCAVGVESTVLSLLETSPKILRHGGVPAESLATLLKVSIDELVGGASVVEHTLSPGMQLVHYSPRTPLTIAGESALPEPHKRVGIITIGNASTLPSQFPQAEVRCLTESGDFEEMARNLFARLRELDGLNLDAIVVERCEERLLGRAVMDRLRRAAAKRI